MYEQTFETYLREYTAEQEVIVKAHSDIHKLYHYLDVGVWAASKLLPAYIIVHEKDNSNHINISNMPMNFCRLIASDIKLKEYIQQRHKVKTVITSDEVQQCFTKSSLFCFEVCINFIRDVKDNYCQALLSNHMNNPVFSIPDKIIPFFIGFENLSISRSKTALEPIPVEYLLRQ